MKKVLIFALSFALLLALTACGSKEAEVTGPPDQEITMTATNWQFDQPEYTVKKGETIKLTLVNEQGAHGIEIKDFKVNLSGSKKTQTFVANKAGTFDIKCSISCGPGHNDMVSKLIVTE